MCREHVKQAREILARLAESGFKGYDPYDALNAPFADLIGSSQLAQRLLTQAVRRSPLPLQPLIGALPAVSATTLGYCLSALSRLPDCSSEVGAADMARRLRSALQESAAVSTNQELAWGSHTKVTTRFGHTAHATPNVVVTSVVAQGLIEATSAGLLDARDELQRIVGWGRTRLRRIEADGAVWFSYTPHENRMIHNGSALCIRFLHGAGTLTGDAEAIADGDAAILTLSRFQRSDGSWPYAEVPAGNWVDGFHTGFILEMLGRHLEVSAGQMSLDLLSSGGKFYVRHLFGTEGQPKYSYERPMPYDAMAAAQALEVLPFLEGRVDGAGRLLELVRRWTDRHMLLGGGRVAYQVHRHWTDRRQFPRWSMAPLAAALAGLPGGGKPGGSAR